MRLVQLKLEDGSRAVAESSTGVLRLLDDVDHLYDLARTAIRTNASLEVLAGSLIGERSLDFDEALSRGQVLTPIDHEDPAHLHLTGTGLTHLGSADTRDAMHDQADENLTDSMKMFRLGVEGGKPAPGQIGATPEWFYKGDGTFAVAPEQALPSPDFALDGGEEAEICGIYLIGPNGTPFRLGFALANEFSDHVLEKQNYLYLAHSKLRPSSFGPELLLGALPDHVEGETSVIRNGETVWTKPFVSGEANMAHTIANLEHHHFKYDWFRRPGDVHVHFFGAATLSFADGITCQPGDSFVISSPTFGKPLRNTLETFAAEPVEVKAL
ncbi:MAG: AraD1 family protein [Geminicoccaceae bacterium]